MAGYKRKNNYKSGKRGFKKDYEEAMSIIIASERRRAYKEAEREVVSRYSEFATEW